MSFFAAKRSKGRDLLIAAGSAGAHTHFACGGAANGTGGTARRRRHRGRGALGSTAEAEIRIAVAGDMTGANAWFGEQYQRGTELAVADLNANGGVLGQSVELIVGDDACDPDQAVALAHKLVSDGVVFVAGHFCSHASIPASKIYEEADVLMIAPNSVNSRLTDEGGPNVFRVCGRDDRQGAKVADYLARHWADEAIAILDDGTVWGAGVANAVRRELQERGVAVAVDESYALGDLDYSALVSKMQAGGTDVVFVGGYHRETGLIFRQARDRGYDLRLIASSAAATADFPIIAGPGLDDTLMVAAADMRQSPQAASVVARFRAQDYEPQGYTLNAYAVVQVWAQAVAAAGSLEPGAVILAMHRRHFDTVLGRIGFDEKGDVTGFDPWRWYVWKGGDYEPAENF